MFLDKFEENCLTGKKFMSLSNCYLALALFRKVKK